MHTFIQRGTRIRTEVGTDERPEVVRWTTWDGGPFKQSYALISPEGTVLVDPVRPIRPDKGPALPPSVFEQYTGRKHIAVVCTTPFHERNIYWFRENTGAPIYLPREAASAFEGEPDHLYEDGDVLPGGARALSTGDETGEMMLLWQTPAGKQVLFSGDTINGQSAVGGFDGTVEASWLQVGGIRLRMEGKVDADEMKQRYERLLDVEFDIILNGHNPKPIDQNPKGALRKVLTEGTHEFFEYEAGACSFLWVDLSE